MYGVVVKSSTKAKQLPPEPEEEEEAEDPEGGSRIEEAVAIADEEEAEANEGALAAEAEDVAAAGSVRSSSRSSAAVDRKYGSKVPLQGTADSRCWATCSPSLRSLSNGATLTELALRCSCIISVNELLPLLR